MRSQEERMRNHIAWMDHNLDVADVALWHALSSLQGIAKQRGKDSSSYALVLSITVAETRARVQELKRAVERELSDLVDDDFPKKEGKGMTEEYAEHRTMSFWDAVKAMDRGHIVRMAVNPKKYYKMGNDGETYVSRGIVGEKLAEYVGCDPEGWHNAAFFSRHIIGDWVICDEEVPIDGAEEEAEE